MNNNLLHQAFEEQVYLSPKKIAILSENSSITYEELNNKANKMANVLLRQFDVSKKIVAIEMTASIDMVASILAILKIGSAFLPLNPLEPLQRKQTILTTCNVAVIIKSTKGYGTEYPNCLYLDEFETFECNNEIRDMDIKSSDLAYLIFTSGSTGIPKGVMVEHQSISHLLYWMKSNFSFTENDILMQRTSLCFDASIWEIFLPLISGFTLYILNSEYQNNILKIVQEISTHNISIIQFTPSLLGIFLKLVEHKGLSYQLDKLRYIFLGGEILQKTLVNKVYNMTNNKVRLFNLYGPTETTIQVTVFECPKNFSDEGICPVGYPISDTNIYILDDSMKICRNLEVGEVYISGKSVSKGYINQNNDNFFIDIFDYKSRMYKSGDLGYKDENGCITVIGRKDNQIKYNGYRIELEEIEYWIQQVDNITQSVVFLNDKGNMLIAAYYSKSIINPEIIKYFLKDHIPSYMIPSFFFHVEVETWLPNGKIDKKTIISTIKLNVKQKVESKKYNVIQYRVIMHIYECLDKFVSELLLDIKLEDIGLDSIQFISLVIMLENDFKIEFDDEKIVQTEFETINDICIYIEDKIKDFN